MFCPKCGTQLDDNARFCGVCGNQLTAPSAAKSPKGPALPTVVSVSFNLNVKFLMLVVAILAAIMTVVHLFGLFDVSVSSSMMGQKVMVSMPLSDMLESEEFPLVITSNILFGIANLLIAAVGVLYFLKANNSSDLYDTIYAKYVKISSTFLIGIVGGGTALLQILFYLLSSKSESGMSATICAHWTTWVMLFVYAGMVVLDKMVLNKKAPAAPVNPTM